MSQPPGLGVAGRLIGATLAGLLLTLAFPPMSWWPVAAISVACLVLVVRGRSGWAGFGYGIAFGLAFTLPNLHWITVVGTDAWLGLATYTAVWLGLAGAGTAVVQRLSWWPLAVPAVWALSEAVRSRVPFGGWTWSRIGFSQDSGLLLPWASLAGVFALTFVVVLTGSLLAALVMSARGHRWPAVMAAVAGISSVVLVGMLLPVPTAGQGDPDRIKVAVIQGNVPEAGLDFNAERRAVLDNHVRQTLLLAQDVAEGRQDAPDVVLWPENASDIDPYRNADARSAIDAAAKAIGVPILIGAVVDDPEDPTKVYNQAIVWDPETGPGSTYTKQNLVPFGEYIPFRDFLAPRIGRFDQIPRDFVPGEDPGGLDVGPVRLGTSLCFDVAYDDTMRNTAADGAQFLVVQTNNATYNGTGQTEQQLAMSKVRAVEHGRAVVVVATSGVSAVVGPDGNVVPGTYVSELVDARYVVDVPLRTTRALATALGAVPELLVALLGLVAVALGWRVGRRPDTGGEHPTE